MAQSDPVVWMALRHYSCSFKIKTKVNKGTSVYCRNPNNVSGKCTRKFCPLANSRYATIREFKGKTYLWKKVVERAHTPRHMWEKIKLPRNYLTALDRIDHELIYWPKYLIQTCKKRLTRIHQYLIRMRKFKLKGKRTILVPINKKVQRRERTREKKAMKAARLQNALKSELMQRLGEGTYGDLYDFTRQEAEEKEKVELRKQRKMKKIPEFVEEISDEEEMENQTEPQQEEDLEDFGAIQYELEQELEEFRAKQNRLIDDDDDMDDDEDGDGGGFGEQDGSDEEEYSSDDDDDAYMGGKKPTARKKPSGPKNKPKLELEYEEEHDTARGIAW